MNNLKDLKIGVLRGGTSAERDISLISGQNVINALTARGYFVVGVDLQTKEELKIIDIIKENSIDLVFIALHGGFGEDGGIQIILENHGIPFTGSGSRASFLSMDKIETLKIMDERNIPHPDYRVEDNGELNSSCLKFPLVVKPHYAGSSMGVSIVRDNSELKQAIEQAKRYSKRVIVEEYIEGRELTVGILAGQVLPIIEMEFSGDFFDFFRKYEDDLVRFIIPAKLPEAIYNNIQELAYRLYSFLGCRHFARVDLRIDKELKPYILELNSIPGLTSHSLLPLAAKNIGIDFACVCEHILKQAYQDYKTVFKKQSGTINIDTAVK